MTITAKNNKEKNTHKENANRKIKGRTYLDTIEVRKIITLNLGFLSEMLLTHLIEKYIYFFNKKELNSLNEFYQTYDDIRIGVKGSVSDYLINKELNNLISRGYIERKLKVPEGAKSNIPKYHYTINMEVLDDIIITPNELKLPNKKKYEIQQDIKYNHNTATNKKDTPKVEITDNDITDNMNDKPNDDDDSNNELIRITIEDFEECDNDDEMINNDVKEVIRPIKEPIKEPIDNDNKAIEELNDKQPTEPIEERTEPIDKEIKEHTPINPIVKPIKEFKTAVKPNRAKAKAIIDSKSNPKINDYLDKLKLTNYDIHFLLSDGYTDGSNKDLDDKKRILNLIADNLIEL